MVLFFFLDGGDMMEAFPPFCGGAKAILPCKMGRIALLGNPLAPVSLRF